MSSLEAAGKYGGFVAHAAMNGKLLYVIGRKKGQDAQDVGKLKKDLKEKRMRTSARKCLL